MRKAAAIGWLLAAMAFAQDPFAGVFEGQSVVLELKGARGSYGGTLLVQGQSYPAIVTAKGANGDGVFTVNGQEYRFRLTSSEDGFVLASEGAEYRLIRKVSAAAPAEAAPAAPTPGSLIGVWRNQQGYARFNADGTGEMDSNPGRYEIRGNQMTLTGAQGKVTLTFSVDGDRLTLGLNGNTVVLEREKPRPPGSAGVRPELVGKWCWMTQTNVLNGARQSNRCLTLEANGTYIYEGLTDSYGPNGGATMQSRDVGTWEATDTTLTGRSRSGKVVTYRLEKRNHPKNKDPMIVLDGETFVTFYNKPPW